MRSGYAVFAGAGFLVVGGLGFWVLGLGVTDAPTPEEAAAGRVHDSSGVSDPSDVRTLTEAIDALRSEQRETRSVLRALQKSLEAKNAPSSPTDAAPSGGVETPMEPTSGTVASGRLRGAEEDYVAARLPPVRVHLEIVLSHRRKDLEKYRERQGATDGRTLALVEQQVAIATREVELAEKQLKELADVRSLDQLIRFATENSIPAEVLR